MSALGNGTVPYSPSGPGFILSANAANGTGGMTHAYESNQIGYINAHPIQAVTTGGKRRRRKSRRRNKKSRRGSKKSRRSSKKSRRSSKKSRRRR
jgi:hypothetical protein